MVSLTSIALTAVLGWVIYYFFLKKKDDRKYPPGPWGLPLIGNGIQIGRNMEKALHKWAPIYGDVYQVFLGNQRGYIVTDLDLAKEVFNNPIYSGRPDHEIPNLFSDGPAVGILNSSGKVWLEQRRFTLRHLRDFGFGKKQGETLIVEEVKELLDKYAKKQGTPMAVNDTFQMAIMNTLWQIKAGVRYELDDPRLWAIFDQNKKLLDVLENKFVALIFPKFAKLMPELTGWNVILKLVKDMRAVVKGHVDHHLANPPKGGAPRDFIDSYLNEIEATTDPESSFYKAAGNKNLSVVIMDLFQAGFESVTVTLSWATLYFAKYLEVQEKLQKEMDEVVGRNRMPSLDDRPHLPYVEAAIHETMRITTIVPNGLFHVALEDGKIREYDVPKGTWIACPLSLYHQDPKYFPEPDVFKPERFLSPDGKKFVKKDAFVSFSFGKRVCLGETLARDEIFLFLTHMFHRFTIRLADENPDPDMEGKTSFTSHTPFDYKFVMTERN